MTKVAAVGLKGRFAVGIAGAALVVAIPSSGWAVGLLQSDGASASVESFASFTPASIDPGVARMMAELTSGKSRMMRFTPAEGVSNAKRSVTVAVRIDQETAQAISGRSAVDASREQAASQSGLRIAPMRYNLGLARGYQSFARPPALSTSLSDASIPDLADFAPSVAARGAPSRFAARVEFDEKQNAGAAPRTIQSAGEQSLDVAGSYRLTRNLDVTAGVRYSQDRDRLAPLSDIDAQDSQAVYIGTQFRF